MSTGNHYIIQVKGNQPSLLERIKADTSDETFCVDSFKETTRGRGRTEIRDTFLYKDLTGISPDRIGLKRLIRVERMVQTKKKQSRETAYYISDVRSNRATFFVKHIRKHWGIENRLHRVKDTIMNEDGSRTTKGMAAENISILRNIAIHLFRTNGYTSIKYAIELCANNFKELTKLTCCKCNN
jgi:predicted transposase YbfD/YdcC